MSEDDRTALLRLADFLVEDVMAMSDAELMAEEFEDAAEDLMGAADYLKTALDAGHEVYESKWLGAVMEAHGKLLGGGQAIAAAISTLEQIEREMQAGFGSSFGETREQVRRTLKTLRAAIR